MKGVTKYTTETLAEFALGLRPEEIPAASVVAVQRCVLDLVASAVAGARSEAAEIARGCAERLGGPGEAAIWFGGGNRQAACAAFANSAAASALDLDDGHRTAGGHPGAAVIPAVLAVAQEVQAGWPEVLAALVAGYEVGVRVSALGGTGFLQTRHAFDREAVCLWCCRRCRPAAEPFRQGNRRGHGGCGHLVSRAFRRGLQHGHGQPCQGGQPLSHPCGRSRREQGG